MMKRLEGKNLRHPGCLIGITTGLILGIVLAGVLAAAFNVPLNTDLLIWFGLTLILGTAGWMIGARLTAKIPPEELHLSPTEHATHSTEQML